MYSFPLSLLLWAVSSWAEPGAITTVAGNGQQGFSGDGGPAVQASLDYPRGIAIDSAGNLFIADTYNQRIRKVDPGGSISTIAGNGGVDFSGDGDPAIQVSLRLPVDVAVDAAGQLFIAEARRHRICKVDPSGSISTVADNSQVDFFGDDGLAVQVRLDRPFAIAVDAAGNLFIANTDNHRICKIDPSGFMSTVAGNGRAGFSGNGGLATRARLKYPVDVTVDAAGNFFIADSRNHRIRKVDATGFISTVAGNGQYGFSGDGGPATQARLHRPSGVAVDADGNLYITDSRNYRIRRVEGIAAPTLLHPTAISADPLWTDTQRPRTTWLAPNYPNPFNRSTVLPFQLARPASVRLDLFGATGQRIVTLIDAFLPAGFHRAAWNGTSDQGQPVSAGIYLVRLRAGSFHQVRKVVLVK